MLVLTAMGVSSIRQDRSSLANHPGGKEWLWLQDFLVFHKDNSSLRCCLYGSAQMLGCLLLTFLLFIARTASQLFYKLQYLQQLRHVLCWSTLYSHYIFARYSYHVFERYVYYVLRNSVSHSQRLSDMKNYCLGSHGEEQIM